MLLHGGRIVGFGAPAEVVTQARLEQVFGVVARIEPCSQGHMQVLIDDLADRSRIASQV